MKHDMKCCVESERQYLQPNGRDRFNEMCRTCQVEMMKLKMGLPLDTTSDLYALVQRSSTRPKDNATPRSPRHRSRHHSKPRDYKPYTRHNRKPRDWEPDHRHRDDRDGRNERMNWRSPRSSDRSVGRWERK